MLGIMLLVAWLTGCQGDGIIEPPFVPRACQTGATWCDSEDHIWFNRQTSDGRTTSLCMQHADSLTYVFGAIDQAPLKRVTFLIQWGPEHRGILWADDERRLRFPSLGERSDVIIVEKYSKGNRQDVLFSFRTDIVGTEHQLVRSLTGGDEGDCYIYLFVRYDDLNEFDVARVE